MTQSSSPGLSFPEYAPYISFTMEAKVQQLQAEKARRDKELNEAIQYLEVKRLTEATPRRSLETPGPHRLHEKVQRQEDTLLQQRIEQQEQHEQTMAQQSSDAHSNPTPDPNQNLVEVFKQLTRVMKENKKSETSDNEKFNGFDVWWELF